MKNISEYAALNKKNQIDFFLTDIDDTMTTHGQLHPEAYQALWNLKEKGVNVIPITGRPAGWCEMIARLWPVSAVIGENGAFYFSYENQTMKRWFSQEDEERRKNQIKLKSIESEIITKFPELKISSDQFCRITDLAIDFNEDVKNISKQTVHQVVDIFQNYGATCKISSIHVNGWFGEHNKLSTCLKMLKNKYGLSEIEIQDKCLFVGDSPNDEPMFQYFSKSFGVHNITDFSKDMKFLPAFISNKKYGDGFCEIVQSIL